MERSYEEFNRSYYLSMIGFSAHAGASDIGATSSMEDCVKTLMRGYLNSRNALIEEYYAADRAAQSTTNSPSERNFARARALELSRELDPNISNLRRETVLKQIELECN